jgi:exodeoxyribonuclease VIII
MTITHTEFKPNTEGIFNITSSLYHNHKEAPEISRSLVVEIATRTPAHVRAMLDGAAKREPTKAMISGTLTDMALLEPDKFGEGISHWIRPEGLDLRTKEGKSWMADHPGLPAIYLETDSPNEASVMDIRGMIESVMKHGLARRIVEGFTKQESAFCFHPDTGLLRKCRPDTRGSDNSGRLTIADMKTTFYGGTADGVFSKHCASMAYHVQHAFYSDIYRDLLGEDPFFIFFVVERKPPYAVRMFQIHDEGVMAGREQYKRGLESYARCKASGEWPAYPEIIETIKLPKWALIANEN